MDRSKLDVMAGPRYSMAGLMILVGAIALDLAILIHVKRLWDQAPALAICLFIDGLPLAIGATLAVPFAFRPPARRSRRPPHLPRSEPELTAVQSLLSGCPREMTSQPSAPAREMNRHRLFH